MSFFQSLFKGKPKFPYDYEEEYGSFLIWKLYRARHQENKDWGTVTVFEMDLKEYSQENFVLYARGEIKRLRELRHPAIVKYLDSFEDVDKICLVTEFVVPLKRQLKASELEVGFIDSIAWGLYNIISGLTFLETKNYFHGYLNMTSLFVTKSGDWKLGGGGLILNLTDEDEINQVQINNFKEFLGFVAMEYLAPEISNHEFNNVLLFPKKVHSFNTGILLYELFSKENFENRMQLKKPTRLFPSQLLSIYKHLIYDTPKRRSDISKLLTNPFFMENDFLQSLLFLEEMSLKEAPEVESFMISFSKKLKLFPENCLKYRILPCLVNGIRYSGKNSANTIDLLFQIGDIFDIDDYKEVFVDSILPLFELNDDIVKVHLMNHMGKIVKTMEEDMIMTKIYPFVEKWFTDKNPLIREMCVKSMVFIVPHLPPSVLEHKLSKVFWFMLGDKKDRIRTNTVICLGKVAGHFPERIRKRLLLPSFSKALKDPFVHCRMGALKAIIATREYYSLQEVAEKVLPLISPLLVDSDDEIRGVALQSMYNTLDYLKSHESELSNKESKPKTSQPLAVAETAKSYGQGFLQSFTTIFQKKEDPQLPKISTAPVQSQVVEEPLNPSPRSENLSTIEEQEEVMENDLEIWDDWNEPTTTKEESESDEEWDFTVKKIKPKKKKISDDWTEW